MFNLIFLLAQLEQPAHFMVIVRASPDQSCSVSINGTKLESWRVYKSEPFFGEKTAILTLTYVKGETRISEEYPIKLVSGQMSYFEFRVRALPNVGICKAERN